MDEFEKKKKELLTPLYFEAGAALMDCQSFEFGIALLIFHLSRVGMTDLDPKKIILILDDKDKRTAGQLVGLLKQKLQVSDGIESALNEALVARNRIIHRVMIENIELVAEAKSRQNLVQSIRGLRSQVRKGLDSVDPFIVAFNEALDGVDRKSVEEEAKKLFS